MSAEPTLTDIRVSTVFGWTTVRGYVLGPLAVHRTLPDTCGTWSVTHLASGFAFFRGVQTSEEAIARAQHIAATWPEDLTVMGAKQHLDSVQTEWTTKPPSFKAMQAYVVPLRDTDELATDVR